MLISRYSIFVKINDEHSVLINGLTGGHFLLDKNETDIYQKWKNHGIIDNEHSTFLKQLSDYHFVFSSIEEELQLESLVLEKAKQSYQEICEKNKTATLVLTYDCNFDCPYCYEKSSIKDRSISQMTTSQIDALLKLYGNSLEYINLYGGEPLLLSNEAIIRYLLYKMPNATYSIVTNGYNLLYYLPIFEKTKISRIMITLDGDEPIHNQTRKMRGSNEGTFSKIEKGIASALQNGINVKIRMNITKGNVASCLDLREKMKRKYPVFFESGHLSFELQPVFQICPADKQLLNDQLLPIPINGKANHFDNAMSQKTSRLLQPLFSRNRFVPLYCACNAEMNNRFYDGNGLIYSCALVLGNPKGAVGTYYPKLKYKTNGYLYRNIETLPQCKACIYKFLCGGGCANAVMDEQGNCLYSNCKQIQYELSHVIPSIYSKIIEEHKL